MLIRSATLCSAVLAAFAVGTAGCGSESVASLRPTPEGMGNTLVSSSGLQQHSLDRAAAIQVARCMRTKGFAYAVPPTSDSALSIDFPYGNDDPEFVQQHGPNARRKLGGGVVVLDGPGDENPEAKTDANAPGFEAALYGDHEHVEIALPQGGTATSATGGCFGVGQHRVYGADIARWAQVQNTVLNLGAVTIARVMADPTYLEAVKVWAACVSAKGYQPESPTLRGIGMPNGHAPTLEDALVDARCGAKAKVQATGEELAKKYRAEIEAKYEGQIIDFNDFVKAAQNRVASLQ